MKYILWISLLFKSVALFAQQSTFSGLVVDEKGEPLEYASAALLHPADSTLAFFGISNDDGTFVIRNVSSGNYLLQLALIGYRTQYVSLTFPSASGNVPGAFVMQTSPLLLDGVEVKAERIPLQLKGDTIEYNAGAYKTQPDASVEDLLKKLPGLQVDQVGNIKAQGETVKQVLVDGKEFFSSDPKVATKNLPADAISGVQVFDRKSDEADFTGIDDGSRSKTINLLLKDDKKSAWMGDLQAGIGTNGHYQANAKAFRFTHTNQVAALGMLNNINQFGFSFNDYIDFNGGISSLMGGGGSMRIEAGNEDGLPIDFGQQVNGLITSGAGGLNFTHEAKPGNRINMSFLGNGYDKLLKQTSNTQNFAPGYSFMTDDSVEQSIQSFSNRFNLNFRNAPDSMQRIFANGSAALNNGNFDATALTENYTADALTNSLKSETYESTGSIRGNAAINYLHKGRSNWKVFKTDLSVSAKSTLSETEWKNLTQYFLSGENNTMHQYQDDRNSQVDVTGGFAVHRKLTGTYYLIPTIRTGGTTETLNREQGTPDVDNPRIDSLSPLFSRSNYWLQPGIAVKHSSKKTQWRLALAAKGISLQSVLNNEETGRQQELYFTPQFSMEKESKPGRHFRIFYESTVNAPNANQLLPVTNNINPLELFTGNLQLKPEYAHNATFHWMIFDQFSFTSLFTNLNLGYTKDKINFATSINNDLSQSLTLVNVPNDYTASLGLEFSTPLRPVGLNIHVGFDEQFNRGINYVNATSNTIHTFNHQLRLSFDNRKKEKLEIDFGGLLSLTNATYSVQTEMNNRYFNWSYFMEMHYSPFKSWSFSFNADLNHYGGKTFDITTYIPLLQLEIMRYLFKSNRGVLALKGFDLLNRNSGITQTSEFNYLQQQQSNTIGRYVMLSFKYRLNKFDQGNGGVDIKLNGR
jgi:hypothetical protein